MNSLPDIFYSIVKKILETDSSNTTDWLLEKDGKHWRLKIPKLEPTGFDIEVVADQSEVTVNTEYGAHQHFTSDGNHDEIVKRAMGLVRDLLSENMRLRVYLVRGGAYRFDLEYFSDRQWRLENTTALFVLPWFGRKEQRVYTNKRFAARDFAS